MYIGKLMEFFCMMGAIVDGKVTDVNVELINSGMNAVVRGKLVHLSVTLHESGSSGESGTWFYTRGCPFTVHSFQQQYRIGEVYMKKPEHPITEINKKIRVTSTDTNFRTAEFNLTDTEE